MSIKKCIEIQSGSRVRVADKGSKDAKFDNPERKDFRIISVDGCAIKDGLRADFVVEFPDGRPVIVELKGSKVEHALKQISATAEIGIRDGWLSKPIGALIAASRIPPAANTTVQRGTRAHRLAYGGVMKPSSSDKLWKKEDFF